MNNEQLQSIGPWGYLFALVAVVLALALARLLMSDPQRTIIRMNSKLKVMEKKLDDARKVIADLEGERLKWGQHANEQKRTIEAHERTIEEKEKDIRDLQYARDTLREAVKLKDETIALQKEIIERGELREQKLIKDHEAAMKEQFGRIEWLGGRVIQLEMAAGMPISKLPWKE